MKVEGGIVVFIIIVMVTGVHHTSDSRRLGLRIRGEAEGEGLGLSKEWPFGREEEFKGDDKVS